MSDYRLSHQPDPDGPRLDEADVAFPEIYDRPLDYHHGGGTYTVSLGVILGARGSRDCYVPIFRAVPPGVTEINVGDWVSLSRAYALQHGMHHDDPSQDWPVISKVVRARDLTTDGNDVNEWGYFPV